MSKNETFFVRLFSVIILLTPLYGEITVGLLLSNHNNSKQTLLNKNTYVECKPFGIINLDQMIINGANPKECQDEIEHFYRSHPSDRHFAKENLHLQQSYHYELIKEGCVLYANAAESYSEMMLRLGIALIDRNFDNKEWNGRLKKAQSGAEKGKVGLHDTLIKKFCIKEEK
ncbi:hypothetical protein [Sulfuricurvum sp.]|uniref:hypothetical protein n=1 Tax=Sulfuricurvum sp. TaxID=2025608 RepID=UPI0026069E1B|nr:hypothetical protein [Sulfuricurvum sp.]MDD2779912.1 hypothetical protein [Sulfuricurvum sp.]